MSGSTAAAYVCFASLCADPIKATLYLTDSTLSTVNPGVYPAAGTYDGIDSWYWSVTYSAGSLVGGCPGNATVEYRLKNDGSLYVKFWYSGPCPVLSTAPGASNTGWSLFSGSAVQTCPPSWSYQATGTYPYPFGSVSSLITVTE